MPFDRSIFHRLDQGIDGPRIADLAKRDRGVLADGSIRIFQRGNQNIDDLSIPYPGSADLIVSGHSTECAGGVTPDYKILVLETVNQRIDGRLADGNERSPSCFPHRLRGVTEEFDQDWNCPRIANLP